MNEEVKTWNIMIQGSDMADVRIYAVSGTKDQVKNHLVNLIREDMDMCFEETEEPDGQVTGTTEISDLTETEEGEITGEASFTEEYSRSYVAIPALGQKTVRVLNDEGEIRASA